MEMKRELEREEIIRAELISDGAWKPEWRFCMLWCCERHIVVKKLSVHPDVKSLFVFIQEFLLRKNPHWTSCKCAALVRSFFSVKLIWIWSFEVVNLIVMIVVWCSWPSNSVLILRNLILKYLILLFNFVIFCLIFFKLSLYFI